MYVRVDWILNISSEKLSFVHRFFQPLYQYDEPTYQPTPTYETADANYAPAEYVPIAPTYAMADEEPPLVLTPGAAKRMVMGRSESSFSVDTSS